jgi:hypothetical protein
MTTRPGPRVTMAPPPAGLGASLFAALLLGLALARPALAQVSDPPVVIDAYERARDAQNLDAALAQFADDAVVIVEGRTPQSFNGKGEIRAFLQAEIAQPTARLTSSRHVVGYTVTWTERQQAPRLVMPELWVEAVVRDGKIKSMVYRLNAPLSRAAEAPAPPVPAPLLVAAALAAVGLLAAGVHVLLAGARRPVEPPSRLRGHLLADLDQWQLARRA